MVQLYILALLLLLLAFTYDLGVDALGTFTLHNNCPYTVWPVILSSTGVSTISNTGFELLPDESSDIQAPSGWGGRFWARTHCSYDSIRQFNCLTGDCGSGKITCDGAVAALPATLAEFTMGGYQGIDFYDVTVVDGYNLPLLVTPQAGSRGNCSTVGCVADLNTTCPADLKVTAKGGQDVACKSACAAFNQDKYCCRGAYSTLQTCPPSSYTNAFKSACPRAYTSAYDDTSLFTCAGADYKITFCPEPATSLNQPPDTNNSTKGNESDNNLMPPTKNGTMIYHGETDFVNSTAVSLSSTTSTCTHVLRFAGTVAAAIAVIAAV